MCAQTNLDPLEAARAKVENLLQDLRAALRAYRKIAKAPAAFIHDKIAPPMRPDAVGEAVVFVDRFTMMQALATGPVGAEIGVQHGTFSRFLLDNSPCLELHLFDRVGHLLRPDVLSDGRTTFHKGDSSSELAKLPDSHFDWIYIDGDHSYKGASRDARVAIDKVKPGGILVFNDYTPWSPVEGIPYGVIATFNELINEGHDMVAIALGFHGYFDVALRRKLPCAGEV